MYAYMPVCACYFGNYMFLQEDGNYHLLFKIFIMSPIFTRSPLINIAKLLVIFFRQNSHDFNKNFTCGRKGRAKDRAPVLDQFNSTEHIFNKKP